MEQIPPERWGHVVGTKNPTDCASRGLLLSELLEQSCWWKGPPWLLLTQSCWPKQPIISAQSSEEERDICLVTTVRSEQPIIPFDRYSTFTRLQHVIAWVLHFVNSCRASEGRRLKSTAAYGNPCLTVSELVVAERYLVKLSQESYFSTEIASLKSKNHLVPGTSSSIC